MKTPVYFYVKKNTLTKELGVLTFEIEVVNIGGAMNGRTGYFVAPRSGTYFFIFSAMMYFEKEQYSSCAILLEGLEKGDILANFGSRNRTHSSASLHATSYLKAGAQVYLKIIELMGNPNPKFVLFNSANAH